MEHHATFCSINCLNAHSNPQEKKKLSNERIEVKLKEEKGVFKPFFITNCCNSIHKGKAKFLKKLRFFFGTLGVFVYDRPLSVIFLSILVGMLLGAGWLFIRPEEDLEKQYALPNTRTLQEESFIIQKNGHLPGAAAMVLIKRQNINGSHDSDGLFSVPVFNRLVQLDTLIRTDVIGQASSQDFTRSKKAPNILYDWNYLCERWPAANNQTGGDCMKFSVLEMYPSARLLGRPIYAKQWPYIYNPRSERAFPAQLLLQNVTLRYQGKERIPIITNATGLVMSYYISTENPTAAKLWSNAFVDFMKEFNFNVEDVAAYFTTTIAWGNKTVYEVTVVCSMILKKIQSSARVLLLETEVQKQSRMTYKDYFGFTFAIALVLLYTVVMAASKNLHKAKPLSAVSGVAAALFGALTGCGLCYLCGLRHTNAMNCAPFLILGIGLDDMFVVLNAYSLTYLQKSARQRIRLTLEEAGLAMSITTLTNVVSFTIGASSPYFAVKNFCIVIVAGLIGGYFYALTFFIACLCLEAKYEGSYYQRCQDADFSTDGEMTLHKFASTDFSSTRRVGKCFKNFANWLSSAYVASKRWILNTAVQLRDIKKKAFATGLEPKFILNEKLRVGVLEHPHNSERGCHTIQTGVIAGFNEATCSDVNSMIVLDSSGLSVPLQADGYDSSKDSQETIIFTKEHFCSSNSAQTRCNDEIHESIYLDQYERIPYVVPSKIEPALSPRFKSHSVKFLVDYFTTISNTQRGNEAINAMTTKQVVCSFKDSAQLEENSNYIIPSELVRSEVKESTTLQALNFPADVSINISTDIPSSFVTTELCSSYLPEFQLIPTEDEAISNCLDAALMNAAENADAKTTKQSCSDIDNTGGVSAFETAVCNAIDGEDEKHHSLECSFNGKVVASVGNRKQDQSVGHLLQFASLRQMQNYLYSGKIRGVKELQDVDLSEVSIAYCYFSLKYVPKAVAASLTPVEIVTRHVLMHELWKAYKSYRSKGSRTAQNLRLKGNRSFILDSACSNTPFLPLSAIKNTQKNFTNGEETEKQMLQCLVYIASAHSQNEGKLPTSCVASKCWSSFLMQSEQKVSACDNCDAEAKENEKTSLVSAFTDTQGIDIAECNVEEPQGNIGKWPRAFFLRILGNYLSFKSNNILIFVAFICYLAAATYGIRNIEVGLSMESLFPPNSYLRQTNTVARNYFTSTGETTWILFYNDVKWWDPTVQQNYLEFSGKLRESEFFVEMLNGMEVFLLDKQNTQLPENQDLFILELQKWLTGTTGKLFAAAFSFSEDNRRISHYRFSYYHTLEKETSKQLAFMMKLREILDEYQDTFNTIAYDGTFKFLEADLVIWSQTITGIICAFMAVLLVSCVMLEGIYSILLVTIALFSLILGLLGFMPFLDVKLNMISMVTLIMCIGFCVDYTLHVAHGFSEVANSSKVNRMIATLSLMGSAVLNGCVSTFLSIFPLSWREEFLQRLFFKMITTILFFGLLHGVVLLPVLLSYCGSPSKESRRPPTRGIKPFM